MKKQNEIDLEYAPYGLMSDGRAFLPNPTQKRILSWIARVRAGNHTRPGVPVLFLRGGVGCIEENQMVLMANGEWKAIKDVRINDSVVTFKDGTYSKGVVENHIDSGIAQCYEYTDSASQSIICTDNHKFLTENMSDRNRLRKKGRLAWEQVDNICMKGDHSSHKRPISIDKWDVDYHFMSDEEIILLAYMITDGSFGKKGQSVKFTNITKEYLEEFDRCAREVFNTKPKWYKKGNGYDILLTNGKLGHYRGKGYIDFSKYFEERKYIFHKFSLSQLGLFFNRVIAADGSIYHKARDSRDSNLMKVQIFPGLDKEQGENYLLALKRCGITAHMYSRIRIKKRNYDIHINGVDNLKRLFDLTGVIKGKEKKSIEIINEIERTKDKSNRYTNSTYGRLTSIKRKKDAGKRQLYDLTIADNNNFIVNGFVVHNSGKTRGIMAPVCEMLFEIPDLRVLWGRQDFKDLKLSVMDKLLGDVIPHDMVVKKSEQYHWYDIRNLSGGKPARIIFNGLKDLSGFGSQEFGVIVITEAHEITEMAYRTLKRRLRQANVPVMMLIESEPPNESHWSMRLTDPSSDEYDPDIEMWELSTYENWDNLPEPYKESLESMPKAWQRKYLYGKAGFIPDGRPFYEGFREEIHAGHFAYNVNKVLLTGWDFGFHHPAFVVSQIDDMGRWYILAELMGNEITIDKFCEQVKSFCNIRFPEAKQWIHYGDPACLQHNDKSEKTSWDICKEHGFAIKVRQSTYRTRKEIIDGKLSKMINGKPTMRVDLSCKIIIDGLLGGYHYPEKKPGQQDSQSFEVPFRDGFYEHIVNAMEYTAINMFKPIALKSRARYRYRDKPEPNAGFGFK